MFSNTQKISMQAERWVGGQLELLSVDLVEAVEAVDPKSPQPLFSLNHCNRLNFATNGGAS